MTWRTGKEVDVAEGHVLAHLANVEGHQVRQALTSLALYQLHLRAENRTKRLRAPNFRLRDIRDIKDTIYISGNHQRDNHDKLQSKTRLDCTLLLAGRSHT
jgi:hypothetical protein